MSSPVTMTPTRTGTAPDRSSLLPSTLRVPFHVLAKPTGPICNLDCEYCFFLSKERSVINDELPAAEHREMEPPERDPRSDGNGPGQGTRTADGPRNPADNTDTRGTVPPAWRLLDVRAGPDPAHPSAQRVVMAIVTAPDPFVPGLVAFFIVYGIVIVGSLVMLVVALVDIVRRPDWQWKLAGQEKILWILLVILVNILAIPALIYWFSIRKKLIAVQNAAAAGQFGPGHVTYSGWEPTPPPLVPLGWYPDPSGQRGLRWWDGTRWTDYTWNGDAPAP